MQLKHHFLLAMPELTGDYFGDSLTYICEHNDEGAMGLIVNRPTTISLTELLAHLHLPTDRTLIDKPVLQGGPVSPEQGFIILQDDTPPEESVELSPGIYLAAGMSALTELTQRDEAPDYFVALGYAGWDAGQLEDEMANNAWLSVPANDDILFRTAYEDRLGAAAALIGIDLNLMAKPGRA